MTEKLGSAPKVLIVSNQQTTGPLWVFSLQQQKLHVMLESEPSNTLARWEKEIPDLIILLTPARGEEFVLEAYQAGVDDCMIKPVSPSLFQAKIKVWLRRSGSISTAILNPLKVGPLQLFPSEKLILLKNGSAVPLTNLELRLLYCLMSQPGQIVTIEELNHRVWGYAAEADNTMLKNVVYRLRRKIEADPANPLIIQTVVGIGYKMAAE